MRTPADMEQVLENLDRRLRAVEQILPTLATKDDVHRVATKAELLEARRELSERIDEVKRHTDVRIEDARDDIRKVAEGVGALSGRFESLSTEVSGVALTLDTLVNRLEARGVI